MSKDRLKSGTFMGVVVDNNDPEKIGRCRIKVFQVFDKLPDQDIPWARPWKDLNGNQFMVPDVGKHVTVVFDQGNKYAPEYIYAQNLNINLENKLKSLSGDSYTTMKAAIFDHSTQVYSNSADGLVLDHEYTNIRITGEGNVAVNLRDQGSVLTLGSSDADQQAVLGTDFMDWMDGLVEALMGSNGGAYLDSKSQPVIASPALVQSLGRYRALRSQFLSKHVLLPKNDAIIAQSREYVNQSGDGDTATVKPTGYSPSSQITDQNTGERREYKAGDSSIGSVGPNPIETINVDFSDPKFVGGQWKKYDLEAIVAEVSKGPYRAPEKFKNSLRKILLFMKTDAKITDVRHAAYLLATAYAESSYSLQRWEADYVCTGQGIPYGPEGPCARALAYYRSSNKKKNYYTLGTDARGFPYFGRGLIQLTGKENYITYGRIIGQDLVGNGDLALREDNSYKIAVAYLVNKTFGHVISGNLTKARRSVNGGVKGLDKVNGAYAEWLRTFNKFK